MLTFTKVGQLRTPPPGSKIGPLNQPSKATFSQRGLEGKPMSVLKPGAGSARPSKRVSPNQARAQAAHAAPAASAPPKKRTPPTETQKANRQAQRKAKPDIRRAQQGQSYATR